MESPLGVDKNPNLEIINLPTDGEIAHLKNRKAITSGFGCSNQQCGIIENPLIQLSNERQCLDLLIVESNDKKIFTEPIKNDIDRNLRTCSVS